MIDNIINTVVFWASFAFTIGPFWLMLMQAARSYSLFYIYRHYILYFTICFIPQGTFIGTVVSYVGSLDFIFFDYLYIIGAGIIFYLAYKSLRTTLEAADISYNWKIMSLIGLTNPKLYITAPVGALSAQYTDNIFINGFLFMIIAFPIFLTSLSLWYYLGKIGHKIAAEKFSYFNCFLLSAFACYLLYSAPVFD